MSCCEGCKTPGTEAEAVASLIVDAANDLASAAIRLDGVAHTLHRAGAENQHATMNSGYVAALIGFIDGMDAELRKIAKETGL